MLQQTDFYCTCLDFVEILIKDFTQLKNLVSLSYLSKLTLLKHAKLSAINKKINYISI